MNYGNTLLYGLPACVIQKLQNTAGRVVTRKETRTYYSNTSLVACTVLGAIQNYVFKYVKQEAPLYLSELVNLYRPSRSLRSKNNLTLVTPIVRTKAYGNRRFNKAAATLWDAYPKDLRNAKSVSIFKRKLKHFFRQAFLNLYFVL